MPTKHTITLNDGTCVPWLGFGTGSALFRQDATEFVRSAIDNGIIHLDGAQMYKNETSLGAGIKASRKPRSDLYIVTKLDALKPGQTVKETLKESLTKLGVDYVDLFLIHDPTPGKKAGTLKQEWEGMQEVHKEGLAKSIGVSNFTVDDLKIILDGAKVIPAVNQIELHPYVWKSSQPIVKFCQDQGIILASYSGQTPLARAPGGPIDAVLPDIRERLEKSRGQPVTSAQVLTKWLLQKGAIVVTTSSKVSRIKEAVDAENVPDLTVDEMQVIDDAGSRYHKRYYMHSAFGE